MLPLNISEAQLTQQAADRQTNYLILRSLESKLPQDQFQALLTQVSLFSLTHSPGDAHHDPTSSHRLGRQTASQLLRRVETAIGCF